MADEAAENESAGSVNLLHLLGSPGRFYKHVLKKGSQTAPAVILLVVGAIVGGVAFQYYIDESFKYQVHITQVELMVVVAGFGALLFGCLFSAVAFLLARKIFGAERGTSKDAFIVTGYAALPLLFAVIPYGLALALCWSFVIAGNGWQTAFGFERKKAVVLETALSVLTALVVASPFIAFKAGALVTGLASRPGPPRTDTLKKQFLGKPAPDVEFKPYGQETIRLSSLKGKVVVLDFWATWCGPCKLGLPVVARVVKSFKTEGSKNDVVFYAIGVGGDVNAEKTYLTNKQIDTIGASCDGACPEAFSVHVIPETVVIDKEGVVRGIHSGFRPGEDKELSEEIAACLAPARQSSEKESSAKEPAEKAAPAEPEPKS